MPGFFKYIDQPSAGTYNYTINGVVGVTGKQVFFSNLKLYAFELY